MVVKNGSLVNSHGIRDACHQLVCIEVSILFLKSHVVPGNIFCLIDITGTHIGILKSHGWEVITEEYDHRILITLAYLVDEVSHKSIDLV